jgi:hypothetical protein
MSKTRTGQLILGLAVLVLAVVVGWPFASCEVSYFELRADLRDIASQNAVQIGLAPASTDDEIRATVVRAARKYEIQLGPAASGSNNSIQFF